MCVTDICKHWVSAALVVLSAKWKCLESRKRLSDCNYALPRAFTTDIPNLTLIRDFGNVNFIDDNNIYKSKKLQIVGINYTFSTP